MPLVFPANPTLNQTVTFNGILYLWDGDSWRVQANSTVEEMKQILAQIESIMGS
jgi:hypothetical protein